MYGVKLPMYGVKHGVSDEWGGWRVTYFVPGEDPKNWGKILVEQEDKTLTIGQLWG